MYNIIYIAHIVQYTALYTLVFRLHITGSGQPASRLHTDYSISTV